MASLYDLLWAEPGLLLAPARGQRPPQLVQHFLYYGKSDLKKSMRKATKAVDGVWAGE